MHKSIIETQNLFQIEYLKDGQLSIRTSEYLLSLKEEEQIKVLTVHLSKLKNDLAILEDPALKNSIAKSDEVEKAQLQLLINIIENLLSQI
jgi:predicted double-glycine peptidase